jgi:hypothetical protein
MFTHPSLLGACAVGQKYLLGMEQHSPTSILPKSCVALQVGLQQMVITNAHQVLSSLSRPCLFPCCKNHQALHQLAEDNNQIIKWCHFEGNIFVTSMRHCSKCIVEWNLDNVCFCNRTPKTPCAYTLSYLNMLPALLRE